MLFELHVSQVFAEELCTLLLDRPTSNLCRLAFAYEMDTSASKAVARLIGAQTHKVTFQTLSGAELKRVCQLCACLCVCLWVRVWMFDRF